MSLVVRWKYLTTLTSIYQPWQISDNSDSYFSDEGDTKTISFDTPDELVGSPASLEFHYNCNFT